MTYLSHIPILHRQAAKGSMSQTRHLPKGNGNNSIGEEEAAQARLVAQPEEVLRRLWIVISSFTVLFELNT